MLAWMCWPDLNPRPISLELSQASQCIDLTKLLDMMQIVGFVLAVLAILAATFTSATTDIFESKDPEAAKEEGQEGSELLADRPDVFHLVFLLGSAYMAMLFTSWSLNNTPGQFTIDYGWFSVWVKMASSWFSAALYVWTLVAPAILRNRNFS